MTSRTTAKVAVIRGGGEEVKAGIPEYNIGKEFRSGLRRGKYKRVFENQLSLVHKCITEARAPEQDRLKKISFDGHQFI
jgi:hypothetical protein